MKASTVNPNKLQISCMGCGKHTISKIGYCAKCQGNTIGGIQRQKKRGRYIISCLGCGTDTSNMSGFCDSCETPGDTNIQEQKDRPIFQFCDVELVLFE